MEYEKHVEKKHILFRAIIEVVGGPKEHIEKAIKEFIESFKKNQDYDVVEVKISDAEEKEKMFSIFAELEIWAKSLPELFDFCIDAMPSSIEILEPSSINLQSNEISNILNDLQHKLHIIDMGLKESKAKAELLDKNAGVLAFNVIALALKNKPLDIKELVKETGIEESKLKGFLSILMKRNNIEMKDDKYDMKNA